LTMRDAFTHHDAPSSESQYYLRSAGDAVIAGAFLFLAETLALRVSPALVLPDPVLYHGAVVCLPLLPLLRLVLRPRPEPGSMVDASTMSPMDVYKRTCRLNLLWVATFNSLFMLGVSDVPGSILDKLRGTVPLLTILFWHLLQRNALDRRDDIDEIFIDPGKK